MRKLLMSAIIPVLLTANCFALDVVSVEIQQQYASVRPGSDSALAVHFKMSDDWHFYADKKTAPDGMALAIVPSGDGAVFSAPVYPLDRLYFDMNMNREVKVFSDNFTVYLPFRAASNEAGAEIKIKISGLTCSKSLCYPVDYELTEKIKISDTAPMTEPAFSVPEKTNPVPVRIGGRVFPVELVLPLAILAGLLLNVMPCVWPILPIIVARIVTQAGENKAGRIALGLAFAAGIILFFAAMAVVNIVLKISFGIVFQWGDQFRNPAIVIAMVVLMVVLAMFMFDVFSFGIPASVSGKGGRSQGLISSIGTGFLAAVLSTPCSGAILAFVLAWAQTQTLALGTITILLLGVGMSLPYIIFTSMPKLLTKIPKPGRWMELFKQGTGFLLLIIAVKLAEAVPAGRLIDVLYYVVILGVCLWLWGRWVSYNSTKTKKFSVRIIAVIIAVAAGFWFLQAPKASLIDWQKYDASKIVQAQRRNRPVLIKFTADWCFSCKVLDRTVYSGKKIADLIKRKNVLAIKADTTQ
ncbi:MAG: DUF255 domain-containing protein, partial [Planctomycetes bacterium]|nr:DUF255 domain-containing protein [Planctomycetota bacterium]